MTNEESFTTSRRNILRGSAVAGGLALGSGLAGVGLNKADAAAKHGTASPDEERSFTTYWLELDGIEGESTDPEHENQIDIDSFSFGVANKASGSNKGSGGGKASIQDMHFTKVIDKASPNLFLSCVTGKHIKSGTITCRASNEKSNFLVVKLEEIFVSSYDQSAGDNAAPTESCSLNFSKIEFKYKPQTDPTGA